jgi:3'5'-cyclic nucleotide phosphodiesterase
MVETKTETKLFLFSASQVDHTGVPNAQLVKEQAKVAVAYNGKSVAKQSSLNVAWDLLMEPDFIDLRKKLCPTAGEVKLFCQLIINVVMATDMMDTDLKTQCNMRWNKAFYEHAPKSVEVPKLIARRKK